MKKTLRIILGVLLAIVMVALAWMWSNIRSRHPGYELDLRLPKISVTSVEQFEVGVSKVRITPNIEDSWVDVDSNARYETSKGDYFVDKNGNGRFDAFWMAGFHNKRPAMGVHDDLWARAVVWDDGHSRVAMVVIDAIGFFHDNVIQVRQMVAEKPWKIDHVVISSTHNHETPDLMGLWGSGMFKSGVNHAYLRFVQEQIVEAIGKAFQSRRPAYLKISRLDSTGGDLVRDTRPPMVMDDVVHFMQFCDVQTDSIVSLLMNWGDHPETLASDNLFITSDFCHYWITGVEEGITYNGEIKRPGVNCTAIYVTGAIGGLMTTLGCNVYDPWLQRHFKEGSFEKARAQGYRLADLTLDAIEKGQWQKVEKPVIRLCAKTFKLRVDNKWFKLGGLLGVLDRGFIGLNRIRSEINLLVLDSAWFLTVPGEIYPEIVNGGVEVPEGADYPGEPIEDPPLRKLMKGQYNFIIGLGNDEVGYILPRSQWDVEAPFTYGAKKAFYGEINSLGPETGPEIYQQAKNIINEL